MSSLFLVVFFVIWIPLLFVASVQASPSEWIESLQVILFIGGMMLIPCVVKWLLWFISGPHKEESS